LLLAAACGDSHRSPRDADAGDAIEDVAIEDVAIEDVATDTLADTGPGDDTAADDADATPLGRGLPEGVSTWRGRFEVAGFGFIGDLTLVAARGDLTATLAFDDDPDASAGVGPALYTLTGTHEPRSGLVALAPDDWTTPPASPLELLGLDLVYDPAARTLSGLAVDYASGSDNSQAAGAGSFTLVAANGAPTAPGDRARGLDPGPHTFFGSIRCTGPTRLVRGTLDYDGDGALAGTVTVGDPDVEHPAGTFAFEGVHDPDTGAITLSPRLWLDAAGTEPLTFFVDGAFDPATGRFDGDMRTNTNACPDDTWSVELDL
ncbi:MAG: hypothetical protein KC635_26200, partial [Myxococcales bacterium]|nr:hypothetical protein [Myxococcales bacterium]